MFFVLSKVLWFITEPSNLLVLLAAVAALGLATRFARAARRLLAVTVVMYVACAFGPVSDFLLRPLEDRFPRPDLGALHPKGIIVLGGAMDQRISEARNALVLSIGGSRMTEGVILSRRYPDAQLIFTGGNGALLHTGVDEAQAAKRLFEALGVASDRIVLEDRSRNTDENAIFTREIVQPKSGEKFILVTSGFHTPRAMGVFRRYGFDVVAWPADYATLGEPADFFEFHADAGRTLARLDIAVREWIGLIAYRLSGKTNAVLPGP